MKSHNRWFKHYNTAHQGQSMSELWAENDTETIAFYWTLIEMVSLWEDPDARGQWSGNLSIFRSKLNMKSQRSRKLLLKIYQRSLINLLWISGESFQLSIPNWLELQETRGGKRHAKKEQKADRYKKEEVRSKNEEQPLTPSGSEGVGLEIEKPPSSNTTLTRENMQDCIQEWSTTLRGFGVSSVSLGDEIELARVAKRRGVEDLKLAIIGMRYEAKTDSFTPAMHVSVERLVKHFSKFRNLGSQNDKHETDRN